VDDSSYRALLARADRHFRRAIESQPANFECRRGCTLCCQGLFEIGAADVAVLVDALDAAPAELREDLVARSSRIVEKTSHPDLRAVDPLEKERFFERADETPCPALGSEGECRIYEDRPLVCRTFGLPLRDEDRYLGEECELNFTEADPGEREAVAWNLRDEDVLGPDDHYTIPEAILLAARLRAARR